MCVFFSEESHLDIHIICMSQLQEIIIQNQFEGTADWITSGDKIGIKLKAKRKRSSPQIENSHFALMKDSGDDNALSNLHQRQFDIDDFFENFDSYMFVSFQSNDSQQKQQDQASFPAVPSRALFPAFENIKSGCQSEIIAINSTSRHMRSQFAVSRQTQQTEMNEISSPSINHPFKKRIRTQSCEQVEQPQQQSGSPSNHPSQIIDNSISSINKTQLSLNKKYTRRYNQMQNNCDTMIQEKRVPLQKKHPQEENATMIQEKRVPLQKKHPQEENATMTAWMNTTSSFNHLMNESNPQNGMQRQISNVSINQPNIKMPSQVISVASPDYFHQNSKNNRSVTNSNMNQMDNLISSISTKHKQFYKNALVMNPNNTNNSNTSGSYLYNNKENVNPNCVQLSSYREFDNAHEHIKRRIDSLQTNTKATYKGDLLKRLHSNVGSQIPTMEVPLLTSNPSSHRAIQPTQHQQPFLRSKQISQMHLQQFNESQYIPSSNDNVSLTSGLLTHKRNVLSSNQNLNFNIATMNTNNSIVNNNSLLNINKNIVHREQQEDNTNKHHLNYKYRVFEERKSFQDKSISLLPQTHFAEELRQKVRKQSNINTDSVFSLKYYINNSNLSHQLEQQPPINPIKRLF